MPPPAVFLWVSATRYTMAIRRRAGHHAHVISFDPQATPAERFALVLELHEFAVEQMRANLRRRMPSATAEQIQAKLAEWSMHRPGAEDGDGVGRRVDPRERFG